MGTSLSNTNEGNDARFIVTAIEVTIVKAISSVSDNLGQNGANRVPGADVEYTLTVTVTGLGEATNLIVSDELPAELLLKEGEHGIIKVSKSGGAEEDMTAEDDASKDDAKYNEGNNTISVDLGTITAGDPASTIRFTTVIQ